MAGKIKNTLVKDMLRKNKNAFEVCYVFQYFFFHPFDITATLTQKKKKKKNHGITTLHKQKNVYKK